MSETARRYVALVSLAAGVVAAVATVGLMRRAVHRMPALSPTDSMIVAGGRAGTPGAAPPSPVQPTPRRTPPPVPPREAPARRLPSDPDAYPRLR